MSESLRTTGWNSQKPTAGRTYESWIRAPQFSWSAPPPYSTIPAMSPCAFGASDDHWIAYSGDQAISNYLGWMAQGFNEDQWNLGDRAERCFVLAFNGKSVNGARIVGSVKGLRGGAPKKA